MEYDEKMKSMAKQEKIKTPDGFEGRIENMINDMTTQRKKLQVRKFRPVFVAAIIGLLVLAFGAITYASGVWDAWFSSLVTYDMDGEQIEKDWNNAVMNIHEEPEKYADGDAFIASAAPGEFRRYGRVNEDGYFEVDLQSLSVGGAVAIEELSSIDALAAILKETESPKLRMPVYFPEGYEVSGISVTYYAAPEIYDAYAPPSETFTDENGVVMQIFKLPANYQMYVRRYEISLINADGGTLSVSAYLDRDFEHQTITTTSSSVLRFLEIDEFDAASYRKIPGGNENEVFTNILALQKVDKGLALDSHLLDYNNSAQSARVAMSLEESLELFYYYDFILYSVGAYGINDAMNEEELTRVINGLIFPN